MTYLSKACIKDGVRDLVTDLVGVALTDRLGGEKEAAVSAIRRYNGGPKNVRCTAEFFEFLAG